MSDSQKNSISVGIGGLVPLVLTLALMWLKVEGQFPYSWWWVFSPFWVVPAAGIAVLAAIVVGGLAFVGVAGLFCAIAELVSATQVGKGDQQ